MFYTYIISWKVRLQVCVTWSAVSDIHVLYWSFSTHLFQRITANVKLGLTLLCNSTWESLQLFYLLLFPFYSTLYWFYGWLLEGESQNIGKLEDLQGKRFLRQETPFWHWRLFSSPLLFFKIVSEWLKAVFMPLTDNKLTGVLILLILRSSSVFCRGVQCS